MKAIKVTSQLKQKNPELFNGYAVNEIYTRGLPNKFHGEENVAGGYKGREDLHNNDGWKDLVQPSISTNQKRGNLILDTENDVFTYEVSDKTEAEIQNEKISQAEFERQSKIQELQEKKIVDEMKALNDTDALANQAVYPLWREGIQVSVDEKYQYFKDGELVLYKTIQAHLTQADWQPGLVPNLFTEIVPEGQIRTFPEPMLSTTTFALNEPLFWNNKYWKSLIANNSYRPDQYPAGWLEVTKTVAEGLL